MKESEMNETARAMEDVFVLVSLWDEARQKRIEAENADRAARPKVPLPPPLEKKPTFREKVVLNRQVAKYESGDSGAKVVAAMQTEIAAEQIWAIAVERLAQLVPISDKDLVAEVVGRTRIGPIGWTDRDGGSTSDWHQLCQRPLHNEPYGWWTIHDGAPYKRSGWAASA